MSNYELIAYSQPRSYITESFRTLRANLQFLGAGDTVKSILLAGGGLNEGTSFITANLGIVFAQAGQKVIIVDCDLRKPQQHLIFNVDNNYGLSSILCGFKEPDDVLKTTVMAGVNTITAGPLPDNPTELLGSSIMKQLVERLREMADIVLLDTPPLAVVSDAAVLSKKVDGVLMVVRSMVASHDSVTKVRDMLANAKANILGVAFNYVWVKDMSEDYYTYLTEYKKNEARSKKTKKHVQAHSKN